MTEAALPTELFVLGLSVLLLIAQVLLPSAFATDISHEYRAGARDEELQSSKPVSRRLKRALANLLETYPAFVGLALALAVAGKTGGIGAAGAWLYLAARIVYVPLYASGVPLVRSLVWLTAIAGILMMLARLMLG
jgi:uncharacterized MAPEG superfamily protein